MIEVHDLTKRYGDFQAVQNVSFSIKKGEIVGLLGPNGAGKSTIMRILTGFLPATSGSVRIAGFSVTENSLDVQKNVGFLPENNPLYDDMTVYEYLRYAASMQAVKSDDVEKSIRHVADVCGLKEKIAQEIKHLSKGYRQRVGLASAFIADPPILILDEPTTGLDPNQIVEIRSLIKKLGEERTVILSSHILSEVEATCQRVLILKNGQIVAQGTPAELRTHALGGEKIIIEIEKDSNRSISEVLKNIEGITNVVLTDGASDGAQKVEIYALAEHDLRKKIIATVLEHKFGLLEIHRADLKLEDVFREVTK